MDGVGWFGDLVLVVRFGFRGSGFGAWRLGVWELFDRLPNIADMISGPPSGQNAQQIKANSADR